MITILAEKPSVAREIARVVGATQKQDGYLEGNGYTVSWALGHLVGLALPEDYGYASFQRESLPMLPEVFLLLPRKEKTAKGYRNDAGVMKQLNVIKKLFEQSERIIVATDAGREGELIFRYIYSYLGCKKPFSRLWISSLTEKAIREGLQKLKAGSDYDNLYHAAQARSEADWLVGINASQALSIAAGRGTYSLGRVQTPTLAMVCKRYLENRAFTSKSYYRLLLESEKDGIPFKAWSEATFESKSAAYELLNKLREQGLAQVLNTEVKEVRQAPPLLFDLTGLQKEANRKYGFSAEQTLNIAQHLYELKAITYPRTGSSYIGEDVFETIPELVENLQWHKELSSYASSLLRQTLNRHVVDDSKVSDHHALLITEYIPVLEGDDERIYSMIAGRMLEALSQECVKENITVNLTSDSCFFTIKGSRTLSEGWRAVWKDEEENSLPNPPKEGFLEGEFLNEVTFTAVEKQTKPKALHTEASLLSAMENAGKELDEEQKRALKDCGLGTPATRAAVIETLLSRDYIRREKKSLLPTEKGLAVYELVKDMRIADVALTADWENALTQIEQGKMPPDTFREACRIYTAQIADELLKCVVNTVDENACSCPKCKAGNMRFYAKVVKCNRPDCGFAIFKNKGEKNLLDRHITDLLVKGKTGLIKGFKSKEGKSFAACLMLDENLKLVYSFGSRK